MNVSYGPLAVVFFFAMFGAPSERVMTTANLNLREAPSKGSPVITVLPEGTELEVLDKRNDGWYQVRTGHEEGYVDSRYVVSPTPESEEIELKTLNDYLLLIGCLLIPGVWIAGLKSNRLTLRGHLFAFIVFVGLPAVTIVRLVVGTKFIVSSAAFIDADAILNAIELILFGAMVIKCISKRGPEPVVVLIFMIAFEVFASKLQPFGGFTMGILTITMGFDEVVFESLVDRDSGNWQTRFFR